MKRKFSFMMALILILVLTSVGGVSYAGTGINELYVSTKGSDSNDGSLAHPFATIDKAASVASPGTVVHVAPGTYGKVITMSSGTADARIVYISDVKWGAIIKTVNAWSSWYNGGSYVDIVGFDVSGNGFVGIQSAASYVRVIGNHVHDIAQTGDPGGNGGAGIQHSWSPVIGYSGHHNETIGNVIHDIGPAGQEIHTIHGIYLTNLFGTIENNMVYNCVGYGIHLWHNTSDTMIRGNLVFENRSGGIIVANGSGEGNMTINDNSIVANNISIYNHGASAIIEGSNDTGPNNLYINNIIYGNENDKVLLNAGSTQVGTIYADPLFVYYQPDGSGDYHFKTTSPAVPQDAYYNVDADYGYYPVWTPGTDWSTALHDLGSGNAGEISAQFDLTVLDAAANGLIGYAGSSIPIGSETDIPILIALDSATGCFKVKNGDNYDSLAQVAYTADTQYHFKIVPDFITKTFDVYITPEGGSKILIAGNYAFQGALEMDGLARLSLRSETDSAFKVENHVLETTAVPGDTGDDDGEYVITSEDWASKQAFEESIHNLGEGNTGKVTMTFDFVPVDKTQDLTIGYADSSTAVTGWSKMSMIISNEIGLDNVYFTARNAGNYEHVDLVPIVNGKLYHFRIVSDLAAKTYSVYVTPKDGTESTIAENYAFRTDAPPMDDVGQLSFGSAFDGAFAINNHHIIQWISKQAFGESLHNLVGNNTGTITITFDFIAVDKTQDLTIGYADSSTTVDGWSKMPMIISNEIGLEDVYFTVRNAGNYEHVNLVPIKNGEIYHFRIVSDLTAKTYSVYVTPKGGTEIAVAENYAFRTDAPLMDDVGQLSFESAFDDSFYMMNHTVFQWTSKQTFVESIHNLGEGNKGNVTITFDFMPLDKTQDLTIGYADSSTIVDGWSKMPMIISNEIGLDNVYFTVRNAGNYEYVNLIPIKNGETYHFRIVSDLTAKTYSVYVTPKDGIEIAVAENYAFRTSAPLMDDIGQLSFGSAFDGAFAISDHSINGVSVEVDKTALIYAITTAQTKVANAKVGTVPLNPGEVLQSDLDALMAAITAALAVVDNADATDLEVNNAITALNSAVDTFDFSVMGLVVYVAGDGTGDFNCDGIDDHVEINEALTYVAENEGYTTVYLKGPFTYNVNATMYISSNTILEGDKTAVIKLAVQDPNFPTPNVTRAIICAKDAYANNIIIRGFEIDGNELNNRSVNGNDHYNMIQLLKSRKVTVNDMYFHNGLGDAIKISHWAGNDDYIYLDTDIKIFNNKIYKVGQNGIYLMCVNNISIYNNDITCRENSGIEFFNSNNAKIYNNKITSENQGGSGITIVKRYGVVIDNIEINNNTISDIRNIGIWVYGYGSYNYPLSSATGVRIHHNIIHGCGTRTNGVGGIAIAGFHNTLIENNVIDGNFKDGIVHAVYRYGSNVQPLGTGYTTIARNNIITNTKADLQDPNTGYGISNNLSSHVFVLENNCVYNNNKGNYNDVFNAIDHSSDINVDPIFADAANYDYHLKSEYGRWNGTSWVNDDVTSPCIDAGNPSYDYSAEPEENGDRINIGAYGNTAEASKSNPYFYDTTAPIITVIGNKEEYILNEAAAIDWSADDETDGSGVAGEASGTLILDTSTIGVNSVTITSTDLADNVATKEIIYVVKYEFSDFLNPIDVNGSNIFNQGRTIPIKLWLKDANGNYVTNAVVKLFIAEIIDGVVGTESEAVSSTQGSSGNIFRYAGHQYIFNYGTKLLSPGEYQLRVDLGDTTINTVNILIKSSDEVK